jgi:PAS domain S-box-containing protein
MLTTRHPVFIFWGPELICLYNDAYAASMGPEKHPAILGMPASQAWPEAYPVVEPELKQVMAGGEATWKENNLVPIHRNGRIEEVYWTYSYGPIHDADAPNGVGGVLTFITETTKVVVARRQSEERFRAFVTASSDVVYRMSPNWGEMWQLDGRGLISDTQAPKRDWLEEYIHPEDQAHVVTAIQKAVRTKGLFEVEHRVRRIDGSLGWTLSRAVPILNAQGEVLEWIGTASDVTARRQAEEELRAREIRLRLALAAGQLGEWELDLETDTSVRALRHDQIFGYDEPIENWNFETFISHVLPEDRPQVEESFHKAAATGAGWHFECRIRRANDGEIRWIAASGEPQLAADGHVTKIFGLVGDITERKRWEEHQQLLINELNHRVKNTLATVQSIASQTLRNAPTTQEVMQALEGRLMALSRTHDVLTRENWEAADLRIIVEQAVEPYSATSENRLHIGGPKVRLPPRMALALAMALQELVTNAVKYGALSNAAGEIRITWAVEDNKDQTRLLLRWEESGGPPIQTPARRGFGTRLIERSLAQDLDGNVSIEFAPMGLVCTVDAPCRGICDRKSVFDPQTM